MSITVTTDVFCDYPHCGVWGHGTVGVDAEPSKRAAATVRPPLPCDRLLTAGC